ncbi:MAG: M15 family metallopeptidase [Chlorobiales bacterium]|nr:M15 family metallopeptidase [Chlorobiales bacterium]
MYKLGRRSLERADGVYPLMIECVERMLSYGVLDVTVTQYGGVRTLDIQKSFVASGASKTLNSLHRIQAETGYGHAIDIVPLPVNWKNLQAFCMMGSLMFRAAGEMQLPLEWGGHWRWKDYPHFQLPRGFKG